MIAPRIAVLESVESLGIAIWKFPFFRALKRAYPGCHITHVVSRKSAFAGPLAPLIPGYVDHVIEDAVIEKPAKTARVNLRALDRADLVFDVRTKVARVVAAKLLVPHGRFVSMMPGWWLTSVVSKRCPRPVHWVGRLMAMIEVATGQPADWQGRIALPDAAYRAAAALLPDGPTYVGLAPGAAGPEKVWPLANFIALAQALAQAGLTPVFLIGPNESHMVPTITEALPEVLLIDGRKSPTEHSIGGPSFALAVAERFGAAVANCTGIGHLMANAGTPLVSLFGPTDPRRFLPWTLPIRFLRTQDFDGTEAMAAIPVDAVYAQVMGVLEDAARRTWAGPDPYTHGRQAPGRAADA
ncbi:MAG: glycosyltransferase family 9 protein [Rhodospirillaceae bacterium]|nr:glycosyltransferase family 9 protein [Rhodospirillaceae bacterium]